MKTRNFFLAMVLSLTSIVTATNAQQLTFEAISLKQGVLSFTTPKEVNVRYYRVEASNDSLNFEVVATFPTKGNTVLPRSYCYDLAGYSYKYYQVSMVEMNGELPHSNIVKKEEGSNPSQGAPNHKPCHDNTGCLVAR